MSNQQISLAKTTSYMLSKFPWVTPEHIANSINNEHSIAKCYGSREKGYARLSSINPSIFNSLFPDATLECFASPLNSHLPSFASVDYYDKVFGSVGDIFNHTFTESVICAHPPNEAPIVKSFLEYVHSQIKDRQDPLKLYLFVPNWPDLDITLGDTTSHIVSREHFSLSRLSDESILTNGNPLKLHLPWVPQQPRVLITFIFTPPASSLTLLPSTTGAELSAISTCPPILTATIDEASAFQEHIASYSDFISVSPRIDFQSLSPLAQLQYQVDSICGIGSPALLNNGYSLYQKLLTEFSSTTLDLQHSKLSDHRASLNELLMHIIPTFHNFYDAETDEQENMIQHSISIAAVYYEIPGATSILQQLDDIYEKWCDGTINEASFDKIIITWYIFSQKVITSWLIVTCPILESLPTYVTNYPSCIKDYATITFNGESNNILLNGSACDTLLDQTIDGIYFCTNTIYDKLHLDALYSSYRHIFSNLIIMSYDIGVVYDIQARYSQSTTTTDFCNDHPAYFTYLLVSNRYLDMSYPIKYLDTDSLTHLILGSHYLGLPVESYSLLEIYKRLKENRWLWKMNKMTSIFDGITKFALDAVNNINISNLTGARSLFIMLQLINDNLTDFHSGLDFAVDHPLIRRCGGVGTDLYLNELPHNSKNLMFMVEYYQVKPTWSKTLEMNMLNRKSVIIGTLVDIRKFDNSGDLESINVESRVNYSSTVLKYDWSYRKNHFHTKYLSESEKSLQAVYFYERYVPSLNQFIVIQILEFTIKCQTVYEYVHPHDMSEVKTLNCISAFREYDDINAFFSSCNFDRDPYSYFPNVHVERRVNDSCFGVDPEPLVSVLVGKEEVVSYLNDLSAVNDEYEPELNQNNRQPLMSGGLREFGLVSSILDSKLRHTNVLGWHPKIVNVVPCYYFDVYRDLSNREFTLMGDRIQYHTARIEMGDHTLFPCPGSNFVWNCKIGHILSGACVRSLKVSSIPLVYDQPKPNLRYHRNHRSNRRI